MREKLGHLKSIWTRHGFKQLIEEIDLRVLADNEFDNIHLGKVLRECPEHLTFAKALQRQRSLRLKKSDPKCYILNITSQDSIMDNYILNVSYYFLGMHTAQYWVRAATKWPYCASASTAQECWAPELVMLARLEKDRDKKFQYLVFALCAGSIEAYVHLADYITENLPVYERLKMLVDNLEVTKQYFANLERNPLPNDYKMALLSYAAENGNSRGLKQLLELRNIENGSGFSLRNETSINNNNAPPLNAMPMSAYHLPLPVHQPQQDLLESISEPTAPNNAYFSARVKVNPRATEQSTYMMDTVCGTVTSKPEFFIQRNDYGYAPSYPRISEGGIGRGF
ncbi:MAG: hypothetical protein IPP74_13930 [Alphaproteobacteria bacterium]|nr:hypothetical protein [Alphaproteobacteria bacterium]